MARNLFIISSIIVLAIAVLARFFQLSGYPASLSMDEIAVGYDSYSTLKTARDQHGEFLPLSFRSVGDYKAPVVFYLTAGSIAIFGQNELGVRFPSAFLGALTVVMFAFLLKEVGFLPKAALLGGIWLAISPWHVFLSRTSFDGIVALFFLVAGLAVFLKSVRNKSILLLTSSLAFLSLSFWSYHTHRIFVPALFVFLLIFFRAKLKFIYKPLQKLAFPLVVFLIFSAPFIYLSIFSKGVFSRISDLWFAKDTTTTWASQYLNYFDINLWFAKGLNFTPAGFFDVGFLYFADFPLFVLGGYSLIRSRNKFLKYLTLLWFFMGPLAGSLTRGGINPGRTLIWLPFFGFVMAASFNFILESLKSWKILLAYSVFVIWCSMFFWNMFTRNFPKYYADLWHYGYKEVSLYACQNHQKYDKIIITDKYGSQWPSVKTIPYLYVLFYCKWDPALYLADKRLYNIEFRQPQWRIDSKEENYLLIGSRWDFPEGFDQKKVMKRIYFPSGKEAFWFVETKK